LRVGNWLRRKESDTNVQVDSFLLNVSYLTSYTPIPLTGEILLKCGFEKDDVFKNMFKYLNNHDCDTNKLTFREEEGFICFDGIKYRTLLKHITHLHQLQNLYFALTGEELTFKL
jgi:hypothetical protein